jgi:hypothetical protein
MQKIIDQNSSYLEFRWFFTTSDKLVVGGKSDEQNELALKLFSKPNYAVLHTSKPSSPFCIIIDDKPTKDDIKEAAVFCGCFSQQWKKSPKTIDIDVFKRHQLYKDKNMKLGTFGIRGKVEKMKINPELYLVIQKTKLRAVPAVIKKQEVLAKIKPGKLSKEQASEEIVKIIKDKYHFPISKDEIMQAIPSGNISVTI